MTAVPAQPAGPSATAQLAMLARPTRARLKHAPWPALALLASLFVPSDVSFSLGGLRLSPYRVLLIAMFVPAALRVFSGRAGRIVAPDWLMTGFVLWAWLAVFVHHGPADGMEKGGIFTVEALGGYLVTRAYVTDVRKFRATVKALTIAILVSLLWTVPESLTGRHFMKQAFAAAFGHGFAGIGSRMGVTRAFGTFDHPILNGVFCASALGMAYYGLARRQTARMGDVSRATLIGIAAFTSMSSGAVATVMVQLALIVYERVTRMIGFVRGRWWLLVGAMAANYVALDALSNRSGMQVLLSYLTFSPGTAYNRLRIWEFGTAEVKRHPLFGIGFNEWERPSWMSSSMDNFWLVNAVRYGMPAFLCMALATLWVMRGVGRGIRADAAPEHALARRGWLVSLIAVCVAGSTVHFWNALGVYYYVLLGLGVCLVWKPAEGRWVRGVHAAARQEAAQHQESLRRSTGGGDG